MIAQLSMYQQRRKNLLESMRQQCPGSVAYLSTAPEIARNRDNHYPYRHDSYFYYLTGFSEPESSLVLIAGHCPNEDQVILFCREKNVEREIWDGYRYGPDAARTTFGMDQAYAIDVLDQTLPQLLANRTAIFTSLAQSDSIDSQLRRWLQQVRAQARTGVQTPTRFYDLWQILDEMRLFKDAHEMTTMRRAAQISAQAHRRAMQICRPGLREYHLEAELLHEFRCQGAQSVAYDSIVAAGKNSCVLHYRAGDAQLCAGELCLIDAACELDGYAADITRTFPINGKFNAAQRTLYELVLAAQEAAIAMTKPGKHFMQAHEAAVAVLAQGMLDLHLLDRNQVGNVEDVIEKKAYTKFYMHRTGHWLGMDVHDCGAYRELNLNHSTTRHAASAIPTAATSTQTTNQIESNTSAVEAPWRILQAGMVTTIEPGIYIQPDKHVPECYWHIGIRIEDDAVVTAQGCELISRDVPVSADEIEALMAHGKH